MFDLCAEQGSEELRCENYAVYARACQDLGVKLGLWRQELNCGMKNKIVFGAQNRHIRMITEGSCDTK